MEMKSEKPVHTVKIGSHRGNRRLWIEGRKPESVGFLPGLRYRVEKNDDTKTLVLVLDEAGPRIVSKKRKGDVLFPVIDINSNTVLSVFEKIDAVQMLLQPGRIEFSVL